MGNNISMQKINFEDIQESIDKKDYLLINTLKQDKQECLIPNTVSCTEEEKIINSLISKNKQQKIIIYGSNCNDISIYSKYEQLSKLGFINLYIYTGGLFEWLCLQDIYGNDLFPTTKKELDILKYKSYPILNNNYYLTN